ncbi:MAG: hypothetical protein K0Q72_462 [Armatimonadetes bacterium]|nr:hypothetical protein [Armatimonadota bacterium]
MTITHPEPTCIAARDAQWDLIDDLRTFSRTVGAGEDVVLVHGAGVSSRYWQPAQRLLAELAPLRVHALDLPGFGRSQDPPWPPRFPRLARHVERWIDRRVPGRFHLVGQSAGCELSVLIAAAMPERVRSVVLAAPAGLPGLDSVWLQFVRAALDAPREPLSLYPFVLPDYFRCGPGRLLRILLEQKHSHAKPLLRCLTQPVLILRGERDAVFSKARIRELAALVPHAETAEVPGAHGAHVTHSREFATAVTAFLRRVDSQAPRAGTPDDSRGPFPL